MTVIPAKPDMEAMRASAQSSVPAEEDVYAYAQGALNILVIDDERTMRRIVRRLLSDIHVHHIYEAEEGRAGLNVLTAPDAPPIDLVICDLMMSGMDGMGFCNALRVDASLRERRIPVLILTAVHSEMILDVVRQVGASDIAHKPISATELKNRMERLVGFRFP